MEDIFDDYAIDIDSDTIASDFDNYDLYGERMDDDCCDDYGNDLVLED